MSIDCSVLANYNFILRVQGDLQSSFVYGQQKHDGSQQWWLASLMRN